MGTEFTEQKLKLLRLEASFVMNWKLNKAGKCDANICECSYCECTLRVWVYLLWVHTACAWV